MSGCDPRPSVCLIENSAAGRELFQSEYGYSEVGSEISSFAGIQISKDGSRTSSEESKIDEILSVINEGKKIIFVVGFLYLVGIKA